MGHDKVLANTDDASDAVVESLAGMLPEPLSSPVSRIGKLAWSEVKRPRSRAMRAAVDVSGMSREDLEQALEHNPQLVALGVRVLYEASMNGHDEILDMLGAALGAVLGQPERADEVELIFMGLQQLRPDHIRVLEPLELQNPAGPGNGDDPWNHFQLAEHLGRDPDRVFSLAMGLVNSGFVKTETGWTDRTGLRITELGVRVLDVLRSYRAAVAK